VGGVRPPEAADCSTAEPVIISLTTTISRMHNVFLTAARSLLRQDYPCSQIWAFVPANSSAELEDLAASLHHAASRSTIPMYLHAVEDEGPATSYLFALESIARRKVHKRRIASDGWAPSANTTLAIGGATFDEEKFRREVRQLRLREPLLMVCNDDVYHPPDLLSSLVKWRGELGGGAVAVGPRGRRVRLDLIWGVNMGPEEQLNYVVDGYRLKEPYRTGVLSSDRCFLTPTAPLVGALASWTRGANETGTPPGAYLASDVRLNGHLARVGVSRWVVPVAAEALALQAPQALAHALVRDGFAESDANSAGLTQFVDDWEPNLWYNFGGRRAAPTWAPKWVQDRALTAAWLTKWKLRLWLL
jgi:hypothetical protein